MQLTAEHIDYIIKDVHYRGIVVDGLKEELIDHICSAVETEMRSGKRFIDAYHLVLKSFGHTGGLREIQTQTLKFENQTTKIMLRNYLLIAIRSLTKHRFYSLINVIGLATGIAACLVIMLFIQSETGYDRHFKNSERIYRVNGEIKFGGNHYKLAVTSAPFADAAVHTFPEIETAVRFRSRGSYLVKRLETDENIKENDVIWTDSTFFKVFSIPLLEGDPAKTLTEPGAIAISKKMADKYFPQGNALGQPMILDNRFNVKVTAVFQDIPANSHFHFDILIAMAGLDEAQQGNFLSNNFNTYFLLRPGADTKALEAKFPSFIEQHIGPQASSVLGNDFTIEKFEAGGNLWRYTLMPVTDIHLHSDLTAELGPNGDITYVYLFAAIALFILTIACINFMNLSTARSANRAKEVGVRKVMGSLRSHLVRQFLLESVLVSIGAFAFALVFAWVFIPVFNSISQKELSLPLHEPLFYGMLAAGSVAIGVLAGLYPSFFLSAFKPASVLKGNVALGMRSGWIRSSLVIFQFVISIFLVIATITVNRQLNYIQNKKIGFRKDQVLLVKDAYALEKNLQAFKDDVLKNNFIKSGSISGYIPVSGGWRSDNTYWPQGVDPDENNMVGLQTWDVDYDYVKTMGMKIIEGRDFSADFLSDSSGVIVNQAALRHFNYETDPIGKKISTFDKNLPDGSPDRNSLRSWTIIGVVEDFHFESLKQNISPLALMLVKNNGTVIFRFEAANSQDVISTVEKTWKALAPGQPFQYSFLDEDFGRMYMTEQRLGKTFAVFASLAIIIACLGLFALTSFTAEQRTKEIGIRKVLGASVSSIVVLLSKEFGKLILIAFVLAAPLAWYAINWWLKSYTYKVEIGILVYALSGLFAFGVAWITMSYQSIRAARNNPVTSLRSE